MTKRDENGQFLPGISGNEKGRPIVSLLGMARTKLTEIPDGEKKTWAQLFIDRYFDYILKSGDTVAIRDLLDRIDGKSHQTFEVHNEKDAEWLELFQEMHEDVINDGKEAVSITDKQRRNT